MEKNKIFKPKINKNKVKDQITKWRKSVELLINLNSLKN